MAAKPGTATAKVIFKTSETAEERLTDVKSTEPYAADLSDYDPIATDWPGVDDEGANAEVEEWEVDNKSVPINISGRIMPDARNRGVIGYVNWYGDDIPTQPVVAHPWISWTATHDSYNEYSTRVLQPGSVLYRGTRIEPFSAPVTRKWYTTALNSLPYYEKTGYVSSEVKPKEIAAFRVTHEAVLIDMTNYSNIVRLLKLAQGRADVVDSIQYGFKVVDSSGYTYTIRPDANPDAPPVSSSFYTIQRNSEAQMDDVFCEWFDVHMTEFDGWCFIKSAVPAKRSLQLHHDEIYLPRPYEVIDREPYAIREKLDRAKYMAHVGWGPKKIINIDDDE